MPEPPPAATSEPRRAPSVAAAIASLEAAGRWRDLPGLEAAEARGYLLPDEDAAVRLRYTQHLAIRAALLEILLDLERLLGEGTAGWRIRRREFLIALAAASGIVRGTRGLIEAATASRVLRKKLDEADLGHGLPRNSFARLYRAGTGLGRMGRFRQALEFYQEQRAEFSEFAVDRELAPLLDFIDAKAAELVCDQGSLLRERLAYRWFSFCRRHRSAWRNANFELFRWSGSVIAELRQPGVKPTAAAKRITPALADALLAQARPGDIFITRHDDALSNLFLPGFWPHAALHLGSGNQRAALGLEIPPSPGPVHFLEARKDGVLLRAAADTLAVDALIVLRPPLDDPEVPAALGRALEHAGKPYDFMFDFRSSDRLACTEVVYRAFHGAGGLSFTLKEVGGRLCLPAEELIAQCLEQDFRVVAACGIGGRELLTGRKAELALHQTRCGL